MEHFCGDAWHHLPNTSLAPISKALRGSWQKRFREHFCGDAWHHLPNTSLAPISG
jgi:hypothetical protein